jgi:hypothetical protein
MDEWQSAFTETEYDAIVLGTGMKECLISGLLAVEGKKVRRAVIETSRCLQTNLFVLTFVTCAHIG